MTRRKKFIGYACITLAMTLICGLLLFSYQYAAVMYFSDRIPIDPEIEQGGTGILMAIILLFVIIIIIGLIRIGRRWSELGRRP